jgi:1,4-dihydroxy-2-naphthoate polyprenyltransferase
MLKPWLLAARPKTLSAAAVPVLMGSALAMDERTGAIWWVFACALVGALLIQIATNLINDALDFEKGADTAERIGPIRVTQAGLVSAETVLRVAAICLFLAALCGIPLIDRGGWPMAAIGVASIAAAYFYTGGPYPLAYHGMGEIFVLIFFGLVAVGGTFYAHTLRLTRGSLLAGFAAGSLATALLVINNLRDIDGDRRSNKRTLVVRFGERFAHVEVAFFAIAPFVAVVLAAWMGNRRWWLTPLVALPLAVAVIIETRRARGRELNRCLALAGALQWCFGVVFVVGSILG